MTLLDAMHDPALFGPWFTKRAHWQNWEVFLATLSASPSPIQLPSPTFSKHTGRTVSPTQTAREGWGDRRAPGW